MDVPPSGNLLEALGYRPAAARPVHRAVRAAAGTRPGAWFLSRALRPLDRAVLVASRGRASLTASGAGVPLVVLTTTGLVSGRPRSVPLLGTPFGGGIAVIGSNFGQPDLPRWARNLERHGIAELAYRGRSATVRSRRLAGDEARAAFGAATAIYPPFAAYIARRRDREVPIFLLEATDEQEPAGIRPSAD